ncbi:MAG: PAS domain S-box protein [Spirochaetes bacterium]|nr:PAS domain S-box protein [Spirochaetota bacterium]
MRIDIKTLFLLFVFISLMGIIVLFSLWLQHRKRFPGILLWLSCYILVLFSLVLILLRDIIPEIFSIVTSNVLLLAGLTAIYAGLEQYLELRTRQFHNYIIILLFILSHSYFTYIVPDLAMRKVNISLGFAVICIQVIWLMFYRVRGHALKAIARIIGLLTALFLLINIIQVINNLVNLQGTHIFQSGTLDAVVILVEEFLLMALVPVLVLLVNKRIALDLESELFLHKQTADELRKSQEKFSKSFQTSPNAIIISRLEDGKIIEVNDALVSITGYSRDELYNDSATGLNLWSDNKDREKMLSILKLESEVKEKEFRFRMKNGEIRTCLLWSQIIRLSGEKYLISSLLDITERKKTQDELIESRHFLSELIDFSGAGISIKDPEGRYTLVNRIWEEGNSLNREDVLGKKDEELFPPETARKFRNDDLSVIESGMTKEFELELDLKNSKKYILNTIFPIKNRNGEITGICAIGTDITPIKRAEDELKSSRRLLYEIVENSPGAICVKDAAGRYTLVNKRWAGYWGFDRNNVLGKTDADLFPEEKATAFSSDDEEILKSGNTRERYFFTENEHGKSYHLTNIFPLKDNNGRIKGVCSIGTDITGSKKAEEELKQSRQFLSILIEHSTSGFCVKDTEGRYILVNRKWEKDTGFERDDVLGKKDEEIYPFDREAALKYMADDREVMESGESKEFEFQIGGRIILNNVYPLKDDKGNISGICSIGTDITERKEAEKLLAEKRQRLAYILEGTNVGTWEWNYQTGELKINDRWAEIIGYTIEELEPIDERMPSKFMHPDDYNKSKELFRKHFRKETPYYEFELRMRHKNGNWIWVFDRGKVVKWTDAGEPQLICGTHQDINLRKIAEEKIVHMATHDTLTGLPAVNLVNDRLSVAISMARRHKSLVAVMFIDLDGFKEVNDTLGHNAGDFVLQQTAKRLQDSVRETDTVARFGGDEFLIVAAELNFPQDAELIAKKAIKHITEPISFEGHTVNLSASIGIAFHSDEYADMEELIKLADEAMYAVKKTGKNNYSFANKPS